MSISVWQIVIFLAMVGIVILLPVFLVKPHQRLQKREFIGSTAALFGAAIALSMFTGDEKLFGGAIIALVGSIAISALGTGVFVMRLQDIGKSKWLALFFIIPLFYLIFWIWLVFAESEADRETA